MLSGALPQLPGCPRTVFLVFLNTVLAGFLGKVLFGPLWGYSKVYFFVFLSVQVFVGFPVPYFRYLDI